MTKKVKAVLDTNVYLSAVIFGGITRKVLNLVYNKEIKLYISAKTLLEIARKLNEKFLWEEEKVKTAIKAISAIATLVYPTEDVQTAKKDPADDKILECAVEANVDYIVTGDKHLLNLKKFRHIAIVAPAKFLKIVLEKV